LPQDYIWKPGHLGGSEEECLLKRASKKKIFRTALQGFLYFRFLDLHFGKKVKRKNITLIDCSSPQK